MIVISDKPFSGWGQIFGDDAVATAMIDRLIHHAEILSLKDAATAFAARTSAPAQHHQQTPPDRRARQHFLRSGYASATETPASQTPQNGLLFDRP